MAFFRPEAPLFPCRAAEMDARLRARPAPGELLALALVAVSLALFIHLDLLVGFTPFDYHIYIKTVEGDLLRYYYADWLLPLFWLWSKLPFWWGYAAWTGLNAVCVLLAGRVFGGRGWLALLTFQAFYGLFLGQITGLLVGGLALGWWGLAHKRWHLAGFGFWLACTKFQLGLPFGLLLWLFAEISWRERLRALLLPAGLSLLSLAVFPAWPLNLLERLRAYAPYDWANIGLWEWIGAAALLLLLPPLLLPLEKSRRFLALAAAIPLALPYFQQADLLALYVLPIGWLPVLLGNLGFLFFRYGFDALRLLWVVPLSLYLAAIIPALRAWWKSSRGR